MTSATIHRAEAEDIDMLASLRRDFTEEQRGERTADDTYEERFAESSRCSWSPRGLHMTTRRDAPETIARYSTDKFPQRGAR